LINLGLAPVNRRFGASARDLISQRNPTLVAVATAAVLMIAIFALPQGRALFAFGPLHGLTPHR
jgi:hypothetical protein